MQTFDELSNIIANWALLMFNMVIVVIKRIDCHQDKLLENVIIIQ